MSALAMDRLEAGYGSTPVLHGVSIGIEPGEVVCLLGRNGVGKSTVLKAVMGLVRPSAGNVCIDGRDTTGMVGYRVARKGVGYAAQERGLFAGLTVRDNLRLVADGSFEELLGEASDLFPFIAERLDQRAGTLSGGEQKMLVTARALSRRPRLALLDEVSEGVQPTLVQQIERAIERANAAHGTAVLVVEQHLALALSVASRFYVLEKGRVVASGHTDDPDAESVIQRHLVI